MGPLMTWPALIILCVYCAGPLVFALSMMWLAELLLYWCLVTDVVVDVGPGAGLGLE